jgi:hypothetical protein
MQTDLNALGEFIDAAEHSIFRLETLDRYDVESDGGDFERYVNGEDGPDMARKAAWHATLQGYRDRGVAVSRVHVVRSPLSDYLNYELDWGYAYNVAYEDIRILDMASRPLPAELAGLGDFWLVDGDFAAVMHYDDAGRYLGWEAASLGDSPRYRAAEHAALRAAVPFADYRAGRRVA